MLIIVAVILVAVLALVSNGYLKWKGRTCLAVCPVTSERFVVQNNSSEPAYVRSQVASRLASLAGKTDKIVKYMLDNNLPDPVIARRLFARWAKIRNTPGGFRETNPGEDTAAYTVNKGDQMRICIRRKGAEFEDDNTSMFVIAHELGHLMSKSYGHNAEFRRNFSFVTKVAVDLGVYIYQDFSKSPENYCGTDITHSAY